MHNVRDFTLFLICSFSIHTNVRAQHSGCKEITDVHDDDYQNQDEGWNYLKPLYGKTLKFTKNNYTYTIGICTDVLNDDKYRYAGAIEYSKDTDTTNVIGRYNASEIMSGTHWILLKYLDGDNYPPNVCSNTTRHAAIMIVCNHGVTKLNRAQIVDQHLGQRKDCYYLFEIEHCIACISDGCNAFGHSLSPGSIILIGFFSLLSTYLLFGWISNRFLLRRKGWDQVPNAMFWKEIGHLQADGCNMVCRCGSRPEDNYHIIGGEDTPVNIEPHSTSLLSDDEGMLPP